MSTGARMAAYAEHLADYRGNREAHRQGSKVGRYECVVADHCHIHHVDEPDNGDVFRTCLECCHVYVTELDLRSADVRQRTAAWQAELRTQTGPLDHSAAPEARPVAEMPAK